MIYDFRDIYLANAVDFCICRQNQGYEPITESGLLAEGGANDGENIIAEGGSNDGENIIEE